MLLRSLLFLLYVGLLSLPAWALEEGFDYAVLPNPQPTETADKIEVVEVFMYTCPHCYHLEPTLAQWRQTLPGT
jgi:thiol:disulfide interchange protein DsbA